MGWFELLWILIQVLSAILISVSVVGAGAWLLVMGVLKLVEKLEELT